MTPSDYAVRTDGLVKRYGSTAALAGVDLRIPTGSTYGLVGPNGAGKSTLLGILAGVRTPTEGALSIAADRSRVAVLPDTPRWDPWLTAFEVVDLARVLVAPSLPSERVERALEIAGLADAADRRCGGFSRGMLQRLGIAATLVGEPELVLLDEPSSALDPVGRREVLDLITSMRANATVIFSSHILGDVQDICSHVGILHHGHLITQGPINDLLAGRAASAVTIVLENGRDARALSELLSDASWPARVELDCRSVTVTSDTSADLRRRLPAVLAEADVPVVSLTPVEPNLERVFLELTQ